MSLPSNRICYLWLVAALYLSSCATTSTQPTNTLKPSVLHKQHTESVAKIKQFSLKGRLGITTEPKNHSARLAWQHQPLKDNIDIYSPIGGKVANITQTPQQVTLTDNGNKTTTAKSAESLTEKTLGFRLPLSGLSQWILGKPSDKGLVNAVSWDMNGRIITLQQNGWDIQYKSYTDNAGYFLPKKVTLKNDKMTIKLIVEKWSGLSGISQ